MQQMAKLLDEFVVIRKWEIETIILRLDPHGSGLSPTMVVLIMMIKQNRVDFGSVSNNYDLGYKRDKIR